VVEDVGGSDNDDNGMEPTKEIEIGAGPRMIAIKLEVY
jgi:hypothetical protein